MYLLSHFVKFTVTDSPFNTQVSCSKCSPPAWINFLTLVTRDLVNLRSAAALLMLLAALRLSWGRSSVACSCPSWIPIHPGQQTAI